MKESRIKTATPTKESVAFLLEAIPAIHSQTLPPNHGVKGFPLLSGLGHLVTLESCYTIWAA